MPHAVAIAMPVLAGDEWAARSPCRLPTVASASWQREVKALLLAARRDLEALL